MSHQAPPADASKVRAPRTAVPVTPQTRASSLTDLLGAIAAEAEWLAGGDDPRFMNEVALRLQN